MAMMTVVSFASVEYKNEKYDLHIVKAEECYYLESYDVEVRRGQTAILHLRKDWFYIIDDQGKKVYGYDLDDLDLENQFDFQWRKYSRVLEGETGPTCAIEVNGEPTYSTSFYCDIYAKGKHKKPIETVCCYVVNPNKYEHFNYSGIEYRYKSEETSSYRELAIGANDAVLKGEEQNDFVYDDDFFQVFYLKSGDWYPVSKEDEGWTYEWKYENGETVVNNDHVTVSDKELCFKQVTSEDIQNYTYEIKYHNRVICKRTLQVEEAPVFTLLKNGKYRCKQFSYYDFKEAKKGYSATLDPHDCFYDFDSEDDKYIFIQKKTTHKDSKGNKKIRWVETRKLDKYLTYEWRKEGSSKVISKKEILKISKVKANSFCKYTLTVKYNKKALGTATYELTEEDRIYIPKPGKHSKKYKNGDYLVKAYKDDREIGIQSRHPLNIEASPDLLEVWEYYYDWCGMDYAEDVVAFNWTMDGKTLSKDSLKLELTGEEVTKELLGKTITCTGYIRKVPVYEINYKLIDAPGLERVTYNDEPVAVNGDELILTALATPTTNKVDVSYQWFEEVEVDSDDGIEEVYVPISNRIGSTTFHTGTTVDSDSYDYYCYPYKNYAFKVFLTGKDQYSGFTYESPFYTLTLMAVDMGKTILENEITTHVARGGVTTRYDLTTSEDGWYTVKFSDDGTGSDVCGVWNPKLFTEDDIEKDCKSGAHYCTFKATAGEKLYVCAQPIDEFDDIVNVVIDFYKKSAPVPKKSEMKMRVDQKVSPRKNLKLETGDRISKIKSSNKKVVSASRKTIKAVKPGTATITITTNCGFTASYKVKVYKK